MPNENPQNLPPDETAAGENGAQPTRPSKGFLNTLFVIFKNFLPALLAAFATGKKTFKKSLQGMPVHDTPAPEDEPPKNAVQGEKTPESESEKALLPQKKSGFFKPKLASFKQKVSFLNPFRKPAAEEPAPAGEGEDAEPKEDRETEKPAPAASNKQKFILVFLVVLIIIISVCGGLYLGGMFDESASENGKPAAAPKKNPADAPSKSLFDTIFGKKSKAPATPREKLAAMHITYNANNFVKYAGQNNMQVVGLFIEAGMSPDIGRTIDGFTPLMAASTFDRSEVAQFLLEKGANVNAQDIEGQTALMKAVRHNRPYMVELLLKNNADHTIADKGGNTAASLAKEYATDKHLAEIFANFDINVSDTKKEPDPAKSFESILLPQERTPAPAPIPGPSPGAQSQPKKSPYLEISVYEFLKMLEPAPASRPETEPVPSPRN